MEFINWLEQEKNISKKSSHDVQSRLGRVLNMVKQKEATAETLEALAKNEEFKALSTSVKSQLRRSVRLYIEYKNGI